MTSSELDGAVQRAIADGTVTLSAISLRVNVHKRRVDGALQRLRRAGKIHYESKGWRSI